MRDTTASDTVHIDVEDPTCTRVNDLLQPLIDNGTVPTVSIFDPPFAELGTENKILMLPSASWMGDFVFKTTYKTPPGELAAAPCRSGRVRTRGTPVPSAAASGRCPSTPRTSRALSTSSRG
jgi:multiple sugar transport system substrate-binding protein